MSNPMVPVVDGKETDLEKFADMIVGECIDIASQEDFDVMNPYPNPEPQPEPDFVGGEKYHINNEDNPLREKRPDVDLTKNVKVEERFEKGKPTEL
jgi:hypothetical protein